MSRARHSHSRNLEACVRELNDLSSQATAVWFAAGQLTSSGGDLNQLHLAGLNDALGTLLSAQADVIEDLERLLLPKGAKQ